MKYLIFIVTLLTTSFALAENKPILTVYAPDYFTSEWGPGPSIEASFEEICDCDLKYSAGDILPRLVLEGPNTKADIVIGLNTDVTKKAIETGVADLKEALKGADTEDIKKKTQNLVQVSMKLGEAIYKSQQKNQPKDDKNDQNPKNLSLIHI